MKNFQWDMISKTQLQTKMELLGLGDNIFGGPVLG
jgi:hypothetical protein